MNQKIPLLKYSQIILFSSSLCWAGQALLEARQTDLPELPPRRLFGDPLDKDFLKSRQMVREMRDGENNAAGDSSGGRGGCNLALLAVMAMLTGISYGNGGCRFSFK